MPQRTILLVEDDPSVRRYLEVVLARAGYSVALAADGLEAMKALLASSSSFAAVVTDAVMPHMDGHQLCRFIRSSDALSHLSIIMLSGIESAASAPAAEEARADAYLSKPVRPQELTTTLARLLSK